MFTQPQNGNQSVEFKYKTKQTTNPAPPASAAEIRPLKGPTPITPRKQFRKQREDGQQQAGNKLSTGWSAAEPSPGSRTQSPHCLLSLVHSLRTAPAKVGQETPRLPTGITCSTSPPGHFFISSMLKLLTHLQFQPLTQFSIAALGLPSFLTKHVLFSCVFCFVFNQSLFLPPNPWLLLLQCPGQTGFN